MADLPEARTQSAPPFTYTGVDLFGPFQVKQARKTVKRYGVIFVCLSSRAVHLETASSLEADSFINAFRRFQARRGPVRSLYCDNGTNFVGAERELRAAIQEMDHARIQRYLLHDNTDWHFNPPASSHMGGVWERMIRSVRKVLSSTLLECDRLDDEVFQTVLCEAECIVNSRPITVMSNDPMDCTPLTPNHILTTKTKVLVPPPGKFQRGDVYMRKRWRRVQHLANLFWSRWKKEYLLTLQPRQKWTEQKRIMQVGDVVVISDDNSPRNEWPMGRVSDVVKDSRGIVRSCFVRTKATTLQRPIHKLVLLLPAEASLDGH